ncbi:hypothetical protein NM208_g13018 [Fusarium decemcellulare]|uniref:Uncharacterized protein n=1 Tax=Fusarium decemcellulare TaxID=57161 RepID=A0ACC1RP32_9HYPO|nr:hypothetical protein NM208_g13018 [Fusarium decemcellulare]
MAANRPRYDDTGPFASLTHQLVCGGPGPQEHDFRMRDTDVTLVVEADSRTLRLLHLQNVRTDTIAEARAAVDDFLDQLDATDHPKRIERTVFENFDKVRQGLRNIVSLARGEVENLRDELELADGSPKRVTDTAPDDLDEGDPHPQDNNPVAIVWAACEDFLEKLDLIDDSHEPRKREAHTTQEAFDKSHNKICRYMKAQAEKRGFVFEWYDGTYPRDTFRDTYSDIMYDVYFRKDGSWSEHSGTRRLSL